MYNYLQEDLLWSEETGEEDEWIHKVEFKADPNMPTTDTEKALIVSVGNGDTEAVKELFQLDPKLNPNLWTDQHQTLLHIAVSHQSESILSFLLEHPGLDPNIPNFNGDTPLLLSMWYGWDRITQRLLQDSRIQRTVANHHGSTPYHYLYRVQSPPLLDWFAQNFCSDLFFETKDTNGDTGVRLFVAHSKNPVRFFEQLLETKNVHVKDIVLEAFYQNREDILVALVSRLDQTDPDWMHREYDGGHFTYQCIQRRFHTLLDHYMTDSRADYSRIIMWAIQTLETDHLLHALAHPTIQVTAALFGEILYSQRPVPETAQLFERVLMDPKYSADTCVSYHSHPLFLLLSQSKWNSVLHLLLNNKGLWTGLFAIPPLSSAFPETPLSYITKQRNIDAFHTIFLHGLEEASGMFRPNIFDQWPMELVLSSKLDPEWKYFFRRMLRYPALRIVITDTVLESEDLYCAVQKHPGYKAALIRVDIKRLLERIVERNDGELMKRVFQLPIDFKAFFGRGYRHMTPGFYTFLMGWVVSDKELPDALRTVDSENVEQRVSVPTDLYNTVDPASLDSIQECSESDCIFYRSSLESPKYHFITLGTVLSMMTSSRGSYLGDLTDPLCRDALCSKIVWGKDRPFFEHILATVASKRI